MDEFRERQSLCGPVGIGGSRLGQRVLLRCGAVKSNGQIPMIVTVKIIGPNLSPRQINGNASSWFAPGVSLLKTETSSELEYYSYQPQAYTIP
jgi:hypothetical protein